jgi:thymidylate synthase ThyX
MSPGGDNSTSKRSSRTYPPGSSLWFRSSTLRSARTMFCCRKSSVLSQNAEARQGGGLSPRELRRAIRSAARSVLPGCTETTLFMTANARALRHCFAVRGGIPGDREMRAMAVELFRAVTKEASAVFFDFEIARLSDGSESVQRLDAGAAKRWPTLKNFINW